MAQKISVIIPSRDRLELLKRLLDSLKDRENLEIIVVNDSGYSYGQELQPYQLTLLENGRNHGLAFSRNQGAKTAKGQYLLFVDDDNVFAGDTIQNLAKCLEENENLIAVGPTTFYLSNPEKIWFLGSRFNLTTSRPFFYQKPEPQKQKKNLFTVENLHNCFMLKKSLADKVGWFDEQMTMSGTEFDLFQRIKKLDSDYFLAIDLNSRCYHDIAPKQVDLLRGLGFNRPERAYFFQRNRAILVAKYGNCWQKLVFTFVFYPVFFIGYSLFFIINNRFDFLSNHLRATRDGYHYLFKKH